MLQEKSGAKGTILGRTSWTGIFQSRQAEGPVRLLAAKWEAETAGGCLTREAREGRMKSRVLSSADTRLFWIPGVSLRGQPLCEARGEPQTNQDLHLRPFVECGGL